MSELVPLPQYRSFDDLPNHVRVQVVRWGESNPEEWVLQAIPALNYRSIVEVMNLPDGETKVLEFFRDLRGMLT
jgi:hypothetical protein